MKVKRYKLNKKTKDKSNPELVSFYLFLLSLGNKFNLKLYEI